MAYTMPSVQVLTHNGMQPGVQAGQRGKRLWYLGETFALYCGTGQVFPRWQYDQMVEQAAAQTRYAERAAMEPTSVLLSRWKEAKCPHGCAGTVDFGNRKVAQCSCGRRLAAATGMF